MGQLEGRVPGIWRGPAIADSAAPEPAPPSSGGQLGAALEPVRPN
jgi:hypothetical protein